MIDYKECFDYVGYDHSSRLRELSLSTAEIIAAASCIGVMP